MHPDLAEWTSHWNKVGFSVVLSMVALGIIQALFVGIQNQIFVYAFVAYFIISVLFLIGGGLRKQRELRDVWKKAHPS